MVVSESSARRYALDPDVRLMLEVRDGNAAAFEELVLRYQGRLLTVLRHLVGSREQAEDLAQEVFLRVYRARESYQPEAKFSTWLYTIANHVAANALRSRSRRHEVTLPSQRQRPDGRPAPGQNAQASSGQMPARQLDKAEMREIVQMALESLGERQRMAVLAEQVRGDELRRDRRRHGAVSPGDQVVALAGAGEPPRSAATLLRSRHAARRWRSTTT